MHGNTIPGFRTNRRHREGGQSLTVAIVVMFLLLFIAGLFIALVINNLRNTKDAAQRVNALRKGQADVASFGATSGQQINLLKTLKSKITLIEGPRETTWSFHLNATTLPFANKDAREAFAQAFDTDSFTILTCRMK